MHVVNCAYSNWIPVESEGFWAIPMDGIEVNGTVIDGTGVRAVIDSGTTYVLSRFPQEI